MTRPISQIALSMIIHVQHHTSYTGLAHTRVVLIQGCIQSAAFRLFRKIFYVPPCVITKTASSAEIFQLISTSESKEKSDLSKVQIAVINQGAFKTCAKWHFQIKHLASLLLGTNV